MRKRKQEEKQPLEFLIDQNLCGVVVALLVTNPGELRREMSQDLICVDGSQSEEREKDPRIPLCDSESGGQVKLAKECPSFLLE